MTPTDITSLTPRPARTRLLVAIATLRGDGVFSQVRGGAHETMKRPEGSVGALLAPGLTHPLEATEKEG